MKRILLIAFLNLVFGLILARCQILVQNSNQISAYNFDGTLIQSNFISVPASTILQGVAVSGNCIYVADFSSGTVCKYNLDGSVAKNSLFNASQPAGIAVDGTNIYVAEYQNGVGKYITNGTTINSSFISGPNMGWQGIAISGTNLYVTTFFGGVKIYGLTESNATFIKAFDSFNARTGIAISGTNFYAVNPSTGTIGLYTLNGATNNASLISGLNNPDGIAILNNVIYVSSDAGTVGSYKIDGTAINTNLISMGQSGSYFGLAFMPPLVISEVVNMPTNSFDFSVNAISNQVIVIEDCTNLSLPNWMSIQTNVVNSTNAIITDFTWTNDVQRFYRVRAQ